MTNYQVETRGKAEWQSNGRYAEESWRECTHNILYGRIEMTGENWVRRWPTLIEMPLSVMYVIV